MAKLRIVPETKDKGGRPRMSNEQKKLEGIYRPTRDAPPAPGIDAKPKLKRLPTKRESKKWIRSAADERAVANGCRFSEPLGQFVVDWFHKYLKFTEGSDWAGKPFDLLDWQRDDVIMPIFGWVRKNERGRIVRRIRKAFVFVGKKQGKSPLAAGVGLYLWAGDGEPGGKIFTVATDVAQAKIIHNHAIRMCEESDTLLANSTINRTTSNMVYKPLHGQYSLATGKESEAGGREGIRAHGLLIDELHAWKGFRTYAALKGALAASPEGLMFQITTAGEETDSVCYEQYEYALGVRSGEIKDDRYLPAIYETPKPQPDDDGNTKPIDILNESLWHHANPSLGHTVLKEDMRADMKEFAETARGTSEALRYRCNVWCTATNPWLNADRWAACYEDFTEESVVGHPCCCALDLATTLDMTSWGFVFKDPEVDGVYRQIIRFVMPKDTFEDRRNLADYPRWVEAGWLVLTPGGECDYNYVLTAIIADLEKFGCTRLKYDETYAAHLTQRLEEEHGIEREIFQQTLMRYAGVTQEYERLVLQGNLKHNGNGLLTWQAGHVTTTKGDTNRNYRPVKRKRGDHRTVDGIQVGVMALDGAMEVAESTESVYNAREEGFRTL